MDCGELSVECRRAGGVSADHAFQKFKGLERETKEETVAGEDLGPGERVGVSAHACFYFVTAFYEAGREGQVGNPGGRRWN